MDTAVTWVWVGTVAGTALLSTAVTLGVTKLVNGRRRSNSTAKHGSCQTCNEIHDCVQRLECLPGKASRTNELLSRAVGHLDTLIQLYRQK